ncbi:indolepyruvate ferredoxin oxidoreductase family protein [Dongia sp.]|uniref:indolepyruvate ferredoxin oxidoreductase family protein n=1 Tax=Dongia sp. TaxID=1977262 RepID=UPI0035AE1C0C
MEAASLTKLATVSLDDKYEIDTGRVYLTGLQALVRLPMMQRRRDERANLNTACYVTGYRGSPLGGIDLALTQAKSFLDRHHIQFQPGVNEDLAATAIWGSQQSDLFGDSKYDGVFAMWYAKGPGVDRSGDVLRHGNLAGSAKHGGVLLLAGDDHTCKSSTTAHQSEYAFMDAGIPVLNPSGVQEILDYGLHGWAMSRYSGCWVAMKVVADTAESSGSVSLDPERFHVNIPTDFDMPEGGLNIRLPASPFATAQALEQEMRLHKYKLYAALAYARANNLNQAVIDGPKRRFGIVTCGKSYLDVRQALEDLGIDEDYAREIGLSLYKVGMTWPLERNGIRQFAEGLEEILVVEEKRALIENQLKEQLYNWSENVRPRVIGKFDESGDWILPSADELTPARIARVIAKRIERYLTSQRINERLKFLDAKEAALKGFNPPIKRIAYFCAGCPHNSSTKVPEGSVALAGIGCHFMSQWMDRNTSTFTHMGGEGGTWIGRAPFSKTEHVFQNMGDGTYYHSGLLAIRAAVAAKVNITFKILFNDAVAMTGGQPMDGPLSVAMVAQQVAAEGVGRVAILSDEPEKYGSDSQFPGGTSIDHRDRLDAVQRDLRVIPGVTVLIFDQTCAAEKRRRRKRKLMVDPPKRAFINERVCEGCGDCGKVSNCVAIAPAETALGRKRQIDQSSCNKDFSCVEGFCPSFVTIHGGALRKPHPKKLDAADFPEPTLPSLERTYNIVVTGVGGTGIVTIGALLGMAAHLEGKGCSVMDMAGLAQKGGAVFSHVRLSEKPGDIFATRIAAGNADLLLGCDIVVSGSFDALAKLDIGRSKALINTHEIATGDFTRDADWSFPAGDLKQILTKAAGAGAIEFIDATRIATALMGDSIATNLFMLGYAYQRGLIPVSAAAIDQAIKLNAVAVESNRQSFAWGRQAALDLKAVERAAAPAQAEEIVPETLADIVAHRRRHLTEYQDAALATRYQALVDRVAAAEQAVMPGSDALAKAVAWSYAKLLAYKDEYEVARLYTDGRFLSEIRDRFDGDYELHFHLAPPLMAKRDAVTGHLKKQEFGPRMMWAFGLLAKFKSLRGTAFDIFGLSEERRAERQMIVDYEELIGALLGKLNAANHATAVALAALPEQIRGFGHVKEAAMARVGSQRAALLAKFEAPHHHADVASQHQAAE